MTSLFPDKYPPVDAIIGSGVLPRMIHLLTHSPSSLMKFEIAWCLTNMTCGEYQHAQAVVDCGAVPVLVGLMLHSVDRVRCCQCPLFVVILHCVQRPSLVDSWQSLWPLGPVSRRRVSSRCNRQSPTAHAPPPPCRRHDQENGRGAGRPGKGLAATYALHDAAHSLDMCQSCPVSPPCPYPKCGARHGLLLTTCLCSDQPLPDQHHLLAIISMCTQLLQSPVSGVRTLYVCSYVSIQPFLYAMRMFCLSCAPVGIDWPCVCCTPVRTRASCP